MKYITCIKQVPAVSDVTIDTKTGTLIREGVPSIINPADTQAIELALRLAAARGGETIAITMGPPQAEDALREALAMGIDRAVLLSDRKFAGADTLATSYTLATAITHLMGKDQEYLVICGVQAIDGDTAQVGPELAEELGIPQVTCARSATMENGAVIVERCFSPDQVTVLETRLPALLTILEDACTPRLPTMQAIARAYDEQQVTMLDAAIIGADPSKTGMDGSRTRVWKVFAPEPRVSKVRLEGTPVDVAEQVRQLLGGA